MQSIFALSKQRLLNDNAFFDEKKDHGIHVLRMSGHIRKMLPTIRLINHRVKTQHKKRGTQTVHVINLSMGNKTSEFRYTHEQIGLLHHDMSLYILPTILECKMCLDFLIHLVAMMVAETEKDAPETERIYTNDRACYEVVLSTALRHELLSYVPVWYKSNVFDNYYPFC